MLLLWLAVRGRVARSLRLQRLRGSPELLPLLGDGTDQQQPQPLPTATTGGVAR